MAAGELMTNVPVGSLTVTDWYKQSVYDPTNTKIGQIMDVLVSPDGKVDTLIVGVGGFLGAGEKDVAVSFSTVQKTMKDNKIYLTMNTTKDALKSAPGFRYDMIGSRQPGCRINLGTCRSNNEGYFVPREAPARAGAFFFCRVWRREFEVVARTKLGDIPKKNASAIRMAKCPGILVLS
jgi:sporulation protein YlmC with PRC-barrel domain